MTFDLFLQQVLKHLYLLGSSLWHLSCFTLQYKRCRLCIWKPLPHNLIIKLPGCKHAAVSLLASCRCTLESEKLAALLWTTMSDKIWALYSYRVFSICIKNIDSAIHWTLNTFYASQSLSFSVIQFYKINPTRLEKESHQSVDPLLAPLGDIREEEPLLAGKLGWRSGNQSHSGRRNTEATNNTHKQTIRQSRQSLWRDSYFLWCRYKNKMSF